MRKNLEDKFKINSNKNYELIQQLNGHVTPVIMNQIVKKQVDLDNYIADVFKVLKED